MNTHQDNINAELIRDLLQEKSADRRWKNIRFFIGVMIFVALIYLVFSKATGPEVTGDGTDYVSLVRLEGMITPTGGFSAQEVLPILKKAFTDKAAKGVILDINSGGGTPVQASIIHDAILEYKKKYHKSVIVIGEDLLASGAYFVAVAADKIYVNPNTLTGSIGVIMKGFGAPELLKKIGVERRIYTAGAHKDRLDPFLPQNPEDIKKVQEVINEIHTNFNQIVLTGRAGKLHATPEELFSGDFWSGVTARKLGLVDQLGNLSEVMTNEFHVSRYKDYSKQGSFLKAFFNQMGATLEMLLSNDHLDMAM